MSNTDGVRKKTDREKNNCLVEELEPRDSFFVGGVSVKTIALANQKGGVGKTTTAASLASGLSRQGKKVLLVDADAQGNLTQMLGWAQPDELSPTLADLMGKIITDQLVSPGEGILHHDSGVDLLPANIELSALEVTLVNAMSRETVMRQLLSTVQDRYDYALIDCMPSLGMMTLNALSAADSVIIPVQAHYLPAKGLEQLLRTVARVKRQLNPKLEIDGIVLTMVDGRTTLAKGISEQIRQAYAGRVFASEIPRSIRAAEVSVENKSIYDLDRNGKAAQAYINIYYRSMLGGFFLWSAIQPK
ncbi:ParA family protein [Flintibacter sp. BX5]|uniref:Sporulation initiation inhibitor protein Soj n=1 Tax=Flintibacter faecis TaxID=2763047 RepID=A0A8J6J5R3_9FIRM|nr:ParA family protein [Flintibacter faecis]